MKVQEREFQKFLYIIGKTGTDKEIEMRGF